MTLKTGGMAAEKVILKCAIIFHNITVLFLAALVSVNYLFIYLLLLLYFFIYCIHPTCIIGNVFLCEF